MTSIDEIVEKVSNVLDDGPFPFVSLATRIETLEGCRINFHESAASPLPAYCISHQEKYFLVGDDKKTEYSLPHHLIIVHPSCLSDDPPKGDFTRIQGRVFVAHELGHIVLHFPRFREDLRQGRIDAAKILENNGINYSDEEEVEATIFAGLVCLQRGIPHWRALPAFDQVKKNLLTTAQGFFSPKVIKQLGAKFEQTRDVVWDDLSPFDKLNDVFQGTAPTYLKQVQSKLHNIQKTLIDDHIAQTEQALKDLLVAAKVSAGHKSYGTLEKLIDGFRNRYAEADQFLIGSSS